MRRQRLLLLLVLCAAVCLPAARGASGAISLAVDARDVSHQLFHSHMEMPVAPGPLTLLYPKYIPGEHGPTGPVEGVTGLHVRGGGEEIAWRRDLSDMYALHLQVPEGVSLLEVDFDFLTPSAEGQFSFGVSVTPSLLVLSWNQVAFYPAGTPTDHLTYQASVTLPAGWSSFTSLETEAREGDTIRFAPVSFTELADSPVLAGRTTRRIELTPPGGAPSHLDLASDDPAALAVSDEVVDHYRKLVAEAVALFGSHHYRHYDFLYTLSDHVAHFGLEHHQSSDDRAAERTLTDDDLRLARAGLLPHELVHSWNGKFRRPADLATPDFQQPMETDLLWVYEGLTTYYGDVLTARSGLWTPESYRDSLALDAAEMTHRPGRSWRPLQDTADEAQVLYETPHAWQSWRRRTDFYVEGALIWLDVDTTIREQSGGRRSLDDFARRFFGMDDGAYGVLPYTFEDLVAALEAVQPLDWRSFLRERLDRKGPEAPLAGLARSGWELGYQPEPTALQEASEESHQEIDLTPSIGLVVDEDGKVVDVLWGGPAFAAGLTPGMKLVAVNGRKYSADRLREAIAGAQGSAEPIEILAEQADLFRSYAVDYHGGPRYPHLVREGQGPDLLGAIIAPRTTD